MVVFVNQPIKMVAQGLPGSLRPSPPGRCGVVSSAHHHGSDGYHWSWGGYSSDRCGEGHIWWNSCCLGFQRERKNGVLYTLKKKRFDWLEVPIFFKIQFPTAFWYLNVLICRWEAAICPGSCHISCFIMRRQTCCAWRQPLMKFTQKDWVFQKTPD